MTQTNNGFGLGYGISSGQSVFRLQIECAIALAQATERDELKNRRIHDLGLSVKFGFGETAKVIDEWWRNIQLLHNQFMSDFGKPNWRRLGVGKHKYECDRRLWAARHPKRRYRRG